MRKFSYKLIFVLFFIFILFVPKAYATNVPDFSLNSAAAFLYDVSSRSSLVRKK